MLKEIVTVPDEILKKISDPIEKVGINEKKLIEDLFETMYHSNGIGLAAARPIPLEWLTFQIRIKKINQLH